MPEQTTTRPLAAIRHHQRLERIAEAAQELKTAFHAKPSLSDLEEELRHLFATVASTDGTDPLRPEATGHRTVISADGPHIYRCQLCTGQFEDNVGGDAAWCPYCELVTAREWIA